MIWKVDKGKRTSIRGVSKSFSSLFQTTTWQCKKLETDTRFMIKMNALNINVVTGLKLIYINSFIAVNRSRTHRNG